MQDIIDVISLTPYGNYVVVATTVCYVLAHVLAHTPVKYTSKIPPVVLTIVNALAANYKYTKNEVKPNDKSN